MQAEEIKSRKANALQSITNALRVVGDAKFSLALLPSDAETVDALAFVEDAAKALHNARAVLE